MFEGMRCYNTPKGPCLFRAKEHMRRFIDSGRVYRMQMLGLEELIEACKLVVRRTGSRMRICVRSRSAARVRSA